MTDEQGGYNGWKNYETWAVALWLDNDQGTYEQVSELVKQAIADDPEYRRYSISQRLKDWLNEEMPDLGASLWADLLGAAFDEVDWYELADNYLAEVVEQDA